MANTEGFHLYGCTSPAAPMVVVAALLDPRWKLEIEADAILGNSWRRA